MTIRKTLVIGLVMALAVSLLGPAALAGKKKKGPKPYKSDEGMLLLSHTLLIASTGEANNVTLQEFENRCEIPTTNGLDAYVWEVPKDYQKIQSNVAARSTATQAWDLYFMMYDKNCELKLYLSPTTSVPNTEDTEGVMPAGIAYVAIANFLGEPANVWWEAKP